MRIYNEAFDDTKGIAEHDIGRLSRHSCKTEQPCHGARYLSIVFSENALTSCTDILRLVSIKSCRANILLKLLLADRCEIFHTPIFLTELLCYPVHALIGALGRELSGDEQFKRVTEV